MWWKIYFWIITISGSIGFLMILSTFNKANFIDVVAVALILIQLLGLYAYVFRKSIFTPQIWKYFFWFWVIFSILQLIQIFSPNQILQFINGGGAGFEMSKSSLLISYLLNLPIYYAIYQLSTNFSRQSR